MILKYLIPFDRFVIETPLTVAQVQARLSAVTVKRTWRDAFRASPGTFEGTVEPDGFTLLRAQEAWSLSRSRQWRNAYRPVCAGKMAPASGGSQIVIRARPRVATIIMLCFILLGFVGSTCGTLAAFRDHQASAVFIFGPLTFAALYALAVRPFWRQRQEFKDLIARALA